MNKKLPLLISLLWLVNTCYAKIITVNNDPNGSAQYASLEAAMEAAAPGDILLVSGSNSDYNPHGSNGGNLTVRKRLTIYGQGYDPRKQAALVSTISVLHVAASAAGAVIAGFSINIFYEDPGTDSITISRCRVNSFGYGYGGNGGNGIHGSNQVWRENLLGSVLITGGSSNIIIQNNIIYGSLSSAGNNTNINILNNYFSNAGITGIANAIINNNIFYYKSANSSGAYIAPSASNCVINNNIYYNSSNADPLSLTVHANSGAANKAGDPKFKSIDLATLTITRTDDFHLLAGSPGINAGTDGKNVGPEGGSLPMQYPYSGQPAIPQIQVMNILNPIIPPNGTLNVNFKANANN